MIAVLATFTAAELATGCSGGGSAGGENGAAHATGGTAGNDSTGAGGGVAGVEEPTCDCDDGFSCTVDFCADGDCTHGIGPNEGATACPVGQYCTLEDGCVNAPACSTVEQCEDAWADDACKTSIACEAASALCTFDVLDGDGDGHPPQVCGGGDCDDSEYGVHPGAEEECNGRDDDCDGEVDEGADSDCTDLEQCVDGDCECRPENQCGSDCVNLDFDPSNCGQCGNACSPGQTCEDGVCSCAPGALCGEQLCAQYNNDAFTINAVHDGYLIGSRGGLLAARPVAEPCTEEWLADTEQVDAVLGDGDYVYVLCRIRAGTFGDGIVGRLNLSSAVQASSPGAPNVVARCTACNFADLTLHGDRAYFVYDNGGPILSALKLGAEETVEVVGELPCDAITGDDNYLYCAHGFDTPDAALAERIFRTSYDGTGVTELAPGPSFPDGLTTSGGFLYWQETLTGSGIIQRIALDGGSEATVLPFSADRFVVAQDLLYVARSDELAVYSTGGDLVAGVTASGTLEGFAVDATHVYWADEVGIYRAPKPN